MRAFAFPGSDVTVTTGLSRARHCAAANGSRAGAGLHGMGVALSAASNDIVETSLGKPVVCKYARRPLAGTWTSHLREASYGARAILALYILYKSIQPTNHRLATSRPIGPRPVLGGAMARIAKNQTATNVIWANIKPHFPLQIRTQIIVSWWYNCLKTPKLCYVYTLCHMGICLGTRMPVSRKLNSLMPTHNDNK